MLAAKAETFAIWCGVVFWWFRKTIPTRIAIKNIMKNKIAIKREPEAITS